MRGSRVTTKIPVATGDSSQDDRPACRLAANGKSRWCFWERSSSDSRPPPGLLRGEGIGKKKGVARVSTTRFGINKDIPGLYNSASQAHLLRVVTRTVFYLCSCWQQAPKSWAVPSHADQVAREVIGTVLQWEGRSKVGRREYQYV